MEVKMKDIKEELQSSDDGSAKDIALYKERVNHLEESLAAEKDARKEDRFVFCTIILILIDIILLNGAVNFWLAIIVLVFEIIILFVIAKRMGAEKIYAIMNRLLNSAAGTKSGER